MGLRLFDAVLASGLPARLKPLAIVLARKADEDGRNLFVGAEWLARALGRQPCIVRRQRAELIAMGVLEAEEIWRGQRKVVRLTAFRADKLPEAATGTPVPLPETENERTACTADRYARTAAPAFNGTPVSLSGTAVPPTSLYKPVQDTSQSTSHPPRRARGGVPTLCAAYVAAYRKRHGKDPVVTSAGRAVIRQVLDAHGVEETMRLLSEFVASDEPFATQLGWNLSAFGQMVNRLAIGPYRRISRDEQRILDNIEAARSVMRQED